MNKMFESLILKTAEIIAEKNKFKEKYEFEIKGCNQLKQSLNEYENKVDDLLLDYNNLKDENIQLKEKIIKLENALDYANGDYIVEEEN